MKDPKTLSPYEQILRDPNRPKDLDLKLMTSVTLIFKGGKLIETITNH